jgi:hypothetical protein
MCLHIELWISKHHENTATNSIATISAKFNNVLTNVIRKLKVTLS